MDKEYSVTIDGQAVTFEFKDSLIHAEGNHAGNIDAIITTKPPLPQNLLLEELHIKVPGTDEYLYIYGYGVVENSLKATFNSSKIVDKQKLPEKVDVYWGPNGEQFIGEMNCIPYSEKVEHKLDDEVLEQEPLTKEESERTTQIVTDFKPESERTTQVVTGFKEEIKTEEKASSNTKWIMIGAVILIVIIAAFIFL